MKKEISKNELSKLNNDLNDTILCKKFFMQEFGTLEDCGFDFENYQDFLEKVIYSKQFYNPSYSKIAKIYSGKQSDMFKYILRFTKSFDTELYIKTLNIILHTDQTSNLHIYNYHDITDFSKTDSSGAFLYMPTPEADLQNPIKHIYLPLHSNLSKEESDVINKQHNATNSESYTSRDMIALMHEISHTFDENRKYLHQQNIHNQRTPKKLIRESLTDITKVSTLHNSHLFTMPKDPIAKELLGETTAITMETLFIEYLQNHSNIPEEDLYNWMRYRIRDSYGGIVKTYAKLSLAKIKENKGYIEQKDIDNIQTTYGLTDAYVQEYIRYIHEDSFFRRDQRYANAGFLVPTIIKRMHKSDNKAELFKQYCELVKEEKTSEALKLFGIDLNDTNSKNELINNMQEFEKKWFSPPHRKNKKEYLER